MRLANKEPLLYVNTNKFDKEMLEAYEYCRDINDIEESKTLLTSYYDLYKVYLDGTNKFLGFIALYKKPSLDAYGFIVYLHKRTSPRFFKHITQVSFYFITILKGDTKLKYFFDVSNLLVAKWLSELTPVSTTKIYDEYYVCYGDSVEGLYIPYTHISINIDGYDGYKIYAND